MVKSLKLLSMKVGLMSFFKLLFGFILLCEWSVMAQNDNTLTIIASGDAHGMVQVCDCTLDPGGGLPKRSQFLKNLGNCDSIILVDEGGFSAGGLYDSYTEGRKADSIKTLQMIKGMSVIGYDAIGVGDDDLQYGGEWLLQQAKSVNLPLISANCFRADGLPLFATHIYVKRGSKIIAITSVTINENLFPIDKKVIIKDPIVSLKKIWKEMASKSDYQIILSHLGNTKTAEIADSLPECDLVVNGHRKNVTTAVSVKGTIPVLEFGFQGKSLSFATVKAVNKKFTLEKSGWYIVSKDIADDNNVVSAINSLQIESQKIVYDLYIMSQCPYGLEALSGLVKFLSKNPDADWNIWFIGTVDSDTLLSSLHGPEEVKDEMEWLAIKDLHPKRWYDFLKKRTESQIPTETIIKSMGIAQNEIDKWVALNGIDQLAGHYIRSVRLNIKASPTLLINNVSYEKEISSDRLLKNQCLSSGKKMSYCDSLPQCLDDADCKKKGKIGKCEKGKCIFADALPFKFSVLIADSMHQHPENSIITTTEDLFPGVNIEKLSINSTIANTLLKTFSPEALPFYLFNKDVKLAHNFDQIGSGLIEKNGSLVFKKGITRSNYYYKRKLEKGKVVLFVDPFFKEITNIIGLIQKDSILQNKLTIVPVIYNEPQRDQWGTEESFRQEEALRWIIMSTFFQRKFNLYLQEYAKSPGSSYWFKILQTIGISTDSFVTTLRANSDALYSQWKELLSLSIREPVVVLFDNREIAVAGNQKELMGLLTVIKK